MTTKRKVRHILLPLEEAKYAEEIQQSLASGQDFSAIAQERSICPSSRRGGEIGWIHPGIGVPPILEDAIFEADVGEIADAETESGVHIFQVMEERSEAEVQQMRPQDLKALLEESHNDVQLIDVREDMEYRIASLPDFKLLPLSRSEEWMGSLGTDFDKRKKTVCLCHHGVRSMRMASLLASEGFEDVHNLSGGIDAYSVQADQKVPQY